MKKILALSTLALLLSCTEKAPKEYVTLQGKVANFKSNKLTVLGRNFKKEIALNEDGSFSDTLKVVDGFHGFNDGNLQSFMYLKNGYDLELYFDADAFPESIVFSGEGSPTNQYLTKKLQFIQEKKLNDYVTIFALEKDEFDARIQSLQSEMTQMLSDARGLEKEVVDMEITANAKLIDFYTSNYELEHRMSKGQPSPVFEYTDNKGNQVSLDEFKGKYVYIDVWATWCAPCKREFPYLKEMDAEYKDKNLAIVSVSIDKLEDKDKWLNMIEDQGLGGVQVLADNGLDSDFMTFYNINGIPRFILIDREGKILNADAPRPSDPNLKKVLSDLNL